MPDPTINDIKNSVLAGLQKAPRGVRGARGKLLHLQDPDFYTDDAELLMVNPTKPLAAFVKATAERNRVSRPMVEKAIRALEDAKKVAVTSSRKTTGIPKLIPIAHEKGYHTDQIGTFAHGRYAGFTHYADVETSRLVSVLHIFDKFGHYLRSDAWDSESGCDPTAELNQAIRSLVRPNSGGIQVQLFEVEFFGIRFGLFPANDNHVEYEPNCLGFNPPWNGLYDT